MKSGDPKQDGTISIAGTMDLLGAVGRGPSILKSLINQIIRSGF
jgi:hypothetical protein